ncbi:hypothetical protein [Sideroxydans lithotrophicus]|uniref:Uncharacterized protein n=1 Tax=Sideroxydans lithotrophicus (strain ES-1) TaxID=580332 RepID=D5CPY5_SIDLE|nr:hypothetical protein [Sideroxydans lithotrophicus]ADE11149.1 hypothetical protein Slit_0911 [Sideroxydans lithotrophicus ES-1]
MDDVMTRQLPAELQALAERIVSALQKEAINHAATGAMPKIELAELQFTRVIDPGNQLPGYEGVWRNARNDRCGTLTINSDNSFFAEYDLFCPHPRDPRWFVEMVTAWGNEESLRSEATLIPNL